MRKPVPPNRAARDAVVWSLAKTCLVLPKFVAPTTIEKGSQIELPRAISTVTWERTLKHSSFER